MVYFPFVNQYKNEQARYAWFTTFAVFALWWIFRLLSGFFRGLHKRRTNIAPPNNNRHIVDEQGNPPAVVPIEAPGGTVSGISHESRLHRIASALRDIFISSLAVVTFNYFANGITQNFNITHYVAVILGVIWSFSLFIAGRIGNILLLPVIAAYVLLWVFGFINYTYI